MWRYCWNPKSKARVFRFISSIPQTVTCYEVLSKYKILKYMVQIAKLLIQCIVTGHTMNTWSSAISLTIMLQLESLKKDLLVATEDANNKTRSQRHHSTAMSLLELKIREEITCISELIKRSTIYNRGSLIMPITQLRKMCFPLNFCKSIPSRGAGYVCRLDHLHW